MATIVLTAVGSIVGGPIGAAIGAAIGQQIDRAVLAPNGAREGPRLKELDIQTSSYGSSIPAIFGAMRVAGTVIWATDLTERRVKSSGGKNRPSTVDYSYAVSMAVALSSRPVARIGRIWADGNLLRGEAGDFKVGTQFRFHAGHHDQPLDPLLASAEAAGQCPAYRGLAYAVFEDLQLADYGNRIPSLTFEIIERENPVPLNIVVGDTSSGLISGESAENLVGYAMSGVDCRAAIGPLFAAFPAFIRAKEGQLELMDYWSSSALTLAITPLVNGGERNFERPAYMAEPAYSVPQSLAIRHYEPARDFQSGVQRSQRSGTGRTSRQIDLPAAIDAGSALRLADLQMLEAQRARDIWTGHVAYGEHRLYPGDWITEASGKRWRIIELEYLRDAIKVTARVALSYDPSSTVLASPGRNLPSPDLLVGETRFTMIDLPALAGSDPGKPQIAVFASGTAAGWRSAALSVRQGDGLIEIGGTAAPAIMGQAVSALPPHNPNIIDTLGVLDVQLFHDAMDIAAGSGSPLTGGAGICWLEGEFLRFGSAQAVGNGLYRLSGLQRGCYGSEGAIGSHATGDRFVLLQAQSGRLIDEITLAPGSTISIEAMGLADAEPVTGSAIIEGRAITPLPPVHTKAIRLADGSIKAEWIRRTRIDFGWLDGVDQPLIEDKEQYALSLSVDDQLLGEWTTTVPEFTLSAAEMAAFQLPDATPLILAIRQIGRYAQSPVITFTII